MRRARSPGAGNTRELRVMDLLAEEGWLCASRRHIGGAGDVLAIRPYELQPAWHHCVARLIEVKSTTRNPWNDFGPADRQALIDTAITFAAEPWLFWWPPRKALQRIHSSEFPKAYSKPQPETEMIP